jgi:hypothetical protein
VSLIFPLTYRCNERGHSVVDLRALFAANAPSSEAIGFDAVLHSRTEIEFIARGAGLVELSRFTLSDVDPELTEGLIDDAILHVALTRRRSEVDVAEKDVVKRYAAEIRAEIDGAAHVRAA